MPLKKIDFVQEIKLYRRKSIIISISGKFCDKLT